MALAEVADCPSGVDGGAGLEQDTTCTANTVAVVARIAPAIQCPFVTPDEGDFV
ncbi:hypothetical protein M879_21590 [Mycobacteroides abscessus V06705]|nr:hypothetical protein M879_21590 [Mycobacteroides abscessus V06705]